MSSHPEDMSREEVPPWNHHCVVNPPRVHHDLPCPQWDHPRERIAWPCLSFSARRRAKCKEKKKRKEEEKKRKIKQCKELCPPDQWRTSEWEMCDSYCQKEVSKWVKCLEKENMSKCSRLIPRPDLHLPRSSGEYPRERIGVKHHPPKGYVGWCCNTRTRGTRNKKCTPIPKMGWVESLRFSCPPGHTKKKKCDDKKFKCVTRKRF